MKPDPRVRRDGKCYTCGGKRPAEAVIERDPFCKTACCREYQGILPKPTERDGRREEGTRKATEKRKARGDNTFEIRGKASAQRKRSDRVGS